METDNGEELKEPADYFRIKLGQLAKNLCQQLRERTGMQGFGSFRIFNRSASSSASQLRKHAGYVEWSYGSESLLDIQGFGSPRPFDRSASSSASILATLNDHTARKSLPEISDIQGFIGSLITVQAYCKAIDRPAAPRASPGTVSASLLSAPYEDLLLLYLLTSGGYPKRNPWTLGTSYKIVVGVVFEKKEEGGSESPIKEDLFEEASHIDDSVGISISTLGS
ncbi:hypothetical protein MBM_01454 [Drepanopeziza brunnea f. sp. 'multigermtubi' MB_m1]|uniref:Uncharacterized protein n=1 Tax=Marssonina brunnea f. sp. multigermtubi (strain MB_m1) TaxID=1072389 RepID=K1X6N9_MARBU|nr:uncharacterized protein MBM_01454 [Drepanopeziza brunnea f. sp. 'multigermtubi' MB_m1]EKD20772.1 hypothetical protein MBM_01454 [Drepanopeziza brunnea f. sp. 'multigermtubi' MB_m1]